MGKRLVDYTTCVEETIQAFKESRVLLVVQGKQGPPNAMAIGWGQIGVIWSKPIFTVLVRPSRYTYTLIEETGEFSIGIVPPGLKKVVQYCGQVSGRDHDKFKEKGLIVIPATHIKTPLIKECVIQYECKIVYTHDLIPAGLAAPIVADCYPKGDLHRLYVSEILACHRED
jgi:flavin reductase (DIM6/NTAB) family NADH-FMN oxidoreductase RutF